MAELTARDAKLIQYLNEAYGKERELEVALEAHISMTTRPPYRKRLQQHLRETKGHAREVERRIKQLGGTAETLAVPGPDMVSEAAQTVQDVAKRGMALAQGPLHAVRGTGEQEKQLKNAKTEFSNEAEEIANYTAIETLAQAVGDRDTAALARSIRRQEERMASFLERLIPSLTKAVAQAEIPASERNGAGRRRSPARRTTTRRTTSRRTTGRRTTARRTTSTRTSGKGRTTAARGRATTARSSSRRSTSARSPSRSASGRSKAAGSGRSRSRRSS